MEFCTVRSTICPWLFFVFRENRFLTDWPTTTLSCHGSYSSCCCWFCRTDIINRTVEVCFIVIIVGTTMTMPYRRNQVDDISCTITSILHCWWWYWCITWTSVVVFGCFAPPSLSSEIVARGRTPIRFSFAKREFCYCWGRRFSKAKAKLKFCFCFCFCKTIRIGLP